MSKEKKIIFSKEIDSAINGYAIGISFAGIGLFLLLNSDYFVYPVISYIIGAIIGAFGVMGTGIELSKTSKIKGMDNFTIGLVVFSVWLFVYLKFSLFWTNILSFVLLVIGVYAICLGLIQAIYSVIRNVKLKESIDGEKRKYSIGSLITQIVLLTTQLCGLAVAILNVLKAANI